MPRTQNESSDDDQRVTDRERSDRSDQQRSDRTAQQRDGVAASAWFANTAVRSGLTVIGIVVLLFALGQAVGLPLLELATDALTSETGQWLVVAFFAVILIGAAQKVTPAG